MGDVLLALCGRYSVPELKDSISELTFVLWFHFLTKEFLQLCVHLFGVQLLIHTHTYVHTHKLLSTGMLAGTCICK